MTLQTIAEALQLKEYPVELEPYYPIPEERRGELCTRELILHLEERFHLFGEYFSAVLEGFEDLKSDPYRKELMDILSLYLKDCTVKEARAIKCPGTVGTPASNMMPFLIHLPSVEKAFENLLSRGFSEEEAMGTMEVYKIYLWETQNFRSGFVGLAPNISSWLTYFTKGSIFYPGFCGLNYQITALSPKNSPYFLKNKATGELLPVFGGNLVFHRSGFPLGSAGAEEEEGSFETVFEETEEEYVGHPTVGDTVSPARQRYPKSEWELALQPGDDVLSVHIFFKTDFNPETVTRSMEIGKELALRCFPERNFKAMHCCSWLLSPVLNEVLGDKAKISSFSSRFVRYPVKSAGKSVFSYVFPGKFESLEDLPENTSLQRALKKRFLGGGKVYETGGVILF
ncbi:MAG: hypothetical protein IKD31_00035 [Clostridia bacterium]|nr:hypothetical protein [Clostridia bacterium]